MNQCPQGEGTSGWSLKVEVGGWCRLHTGMNAHGNTHSNKQK